MVKAPVWHGPEATRRSPGQAGDKSSGLPHSVLLQFFPDSGNLIARAAGSGLPGQPDWHLNLKAQAKAEVEGPPWTCAPRKYPRRSSRLLAARTGHRAALCQVPKASLPRYPLPRLVPPHGSHHAT